MSLPTTTGEFRVAAEPELRFTPSGKAVANFRAVASQRRKNETTQEWEDGPECWLNVTVWGKMAENVVESVEKGHLVIISGRLETRNYETREGEKRTSLDLTADSVGPALTWDTAKVQKAQRSQQSSGQQPSGQQSAPAADPWGTPSNQNEEPPF